jgi:hypothetical protein
VLEHVDRLLAACEARRQSVVVEGVHLSLRRVPLGGQVPQRHAVLECQCWLLSSGS